MPGQVVQPDLTLYPALRWCMAGARSQARTWSTLNMLCTVLHLPR